MLEHVDHVVEVSERSLMVTVSALPELKAARVTRRPKQPNHLLQTPPLCVGDLAGTVPEDAAVCQMRRSREPSFNLLTGSYYVFP